MRGAAHERIGRMSGGITGRGKAYRKTEYVAFTDACDRILGEDIVAQMMIPPYPKSAMDGYAVRAEDTSGADREHPVTLQIVGELFAGDCAEIPYEEGCAVRVMTGSYVPEGYDAVIRQEDTDYGENRYRSTGRLQREQIIAVWERTSVRVSRSLHGGHICVHSIWGFWQVSAFTRCRSVRG